MKKLMTICLLAVACVLGVSAQGIYDMKVKNDVGQDVSLSDYKGKVLLIVNTATRCGFTPQYKELEALYEKNHAEALSQGAFYFLNVSTMRANWLGMRICCGHFDRHSSQS